MSGVSFWLYVIENDLVWCSACGNVSTEQETSADFQSVWGLVDSDSMFCFGWTFPLNLSHKFKCALASNANQSSINRNEYLKALYMLITGQEAACYWTSLCHIAYILLYLQKYMFMSPKHPLCSHTPWFCSLSTLTQAILEMIARLLSDWPAWHSYGASSSSWAFSIWRWYCPGTERERFIMVVTGYVAIRMCSLNTCKSLHGGRFHLVFVHTPLSAVRRYGNIYR